MGEGWFEPTFEHRGGGTARFDALEAPWHTARDRPRQLRAVTAFTHLFEPLQIRGLQTKNRVLMPALGTQMGQGGRVSRRQIDYYAARARGGAGLIVTEAMAVHPSDTTRFNAVDRGYVVSKLRDLDVRLVSVGSLGGVSGGRATVEHEGWPIGVDAVAAVVVVEKAEADTTLAREVRALSGALDVRLIGDRHSPRRALEAVHDGFRLGTEI